MGAKGRVAVLLCPLGKSAPAHGVRIPRPCMKTLTSPEHVCIALIDSCACQRRELRAKMRCQLDGSRLWVARRTHPEHSRRVARQARSRQSSFSQMCVGLERLIESIYAGGAHLCRPSGARELTSVFRSGACCAASSSPAHYAEMFAEPKTNSRPGGSRRVSFAYRTVVIASLFGAARSVSLSFAVSI